MTRFVEMTRAKVEYYESGKALWNARARLETAKLRHDRARIVALRYDPIAGCECSEHEHHTAPCNGAYCECHND